MKYQNTRGGRAKLHSILMPPPEFDNNKKSDALHAMELALSLEKLVNEKLLNLVYPHDRKCIVEILKLRILILVGSVELPNGGDYPGKCLSLHMSKPQGSHIESGYSFEW
nr:ferritin, chloroplastic-like [Ipomoea batatas]